MRIYEFHDKRNAVDVCFDLIDDQVMFICSTVFENAADVFEFGPVSLDTFISAMSDVHFAGYCCFELPNERLEIRKRALSGSILCDRPPRSVCLLFDGWDFDPQLILAQLCFAS